MITIHEHDIDTVLRWAYPQGSTLLAREGGLPLLRAGARALMTSPQLAAETLDPVGLRKLGHALQALGQQHACIAERMLELAEEKAGEESGPVMPHSRYNAETSR
jgi:hypothetical protein